MAGQRDQRHQLQRVAVIVALVRRAAAQFPASILADVADDKACRDMIATTVQKWGRLDVLVNCAGTTNFIRFDDLEKVTDDIWERLFKVNVVGAFHCARAASGVPEICDD